MRLSHPKLEPSRIPNRPSLSKASRVVVAVAIIAGVVFFAFQSRSPVAQTFQTDRIEVRFAHYQLEPGVREALDSLAANYEKIQAARGRNVVVRQLLIPDRIYPVWTRTQLLGGTAPELLELAPHLGLTNEIVGRYFLPLGRLVDEPNPYNVGTELEGIAWRKTFLDNLEGGDATFNRELAEFYGIPLCTNSYGIIVNRDLLARILAMPEHEELRRELGPEPTPRTHDQLIAVCRAAKRYRELHGINLVPIASSEFDGRVIMARLFSAATQRLALETNRSRIRMAGNRDFEVEMITGSLPMDHPAFEAGFSLMREISGFMPPGFLQLKREDSSFLFAQERALMLCIGAYDLPTFRSLVGDRFSFDVFKVPPPDARLPNHQEFVLGEEASPGSAVAAFGIVNFHDHRKRAVAIDFLRYISSAEGARIFSSVSKWVPSVHGVPPDKEIEGFYPDLDGYPPGIRHYWQIGGADGRGAFERGLHLLIGPHGSIDRFVEYLDRHYVPAITSNIRKTEAEAVRNLRRQDSLLGLRFFRHFSERFHADDPLASDLARLVEVQTEIETGLLRRGRVLRSSGISSN